MSSFSYIWKKLEGFWSEKGCSIIPSYDMEVGAATYHPATVFGTTLELNVRIAYLQSCRRPVDGLSLNNPSRFAKFHQFQVLIKDEIKNYMDIKQLFLDSLVIMGFDINKNNIEFLESQWNSPALGAHGYGWEVQYNGTEVCQITLFNNMAGEQFTSRVLEFAYGMERLLLKYYDSNHIYDLPYDSKLKMSIFKETNNELANYYINGNIFTELDLIGEIDKTNRLLEKQLFYGAYDHIIRANHLFNCLDSQNSLDIGKKREYILSLQKLTTQCCKIAIEKQISLIAE